MTATMPFPFFASLLGDTSSSARRKPSLADLKDDNRGAIMMTGLFMSCFLIGSLWFVIGIGDTIVFRDRMQEAADMGAFSSAALHAKGLNFISLCNLILLVAVTIHIILGIIHDIALLCCIFFAIPTFGVTCEIYATMRNIWTTYANIMKPAARVIAKLEKAAAFGYPAIGAVEGYQNGKTYGGGRGTSEVVVLPLSASLIPGGGKSGLPVKANPMNYLCVKLGKMIQALVNKALEPLPGIIKKFLSKVLGKVMDVINKGIQLRYCNSNGGPNGEIGDAAGQENAAKANKAIDEANKEIEAQNKGLPKDEKKPKVGGIGSSIDPGFDSFWGEDGPMTIFAKGANGSAFFSTYAINVSPRMTDESESRVGVARGTKNGMQKYNKQPTSLGYFAQSEFYFDCDANWSAEQCNLEDNATFQIKWRARLKRFSIGKTGDSILSIGMAGLENIGKIEQVRDQLGGIGGAAGALFNGRGITGAGDLQRAFDLLKPGAKKIGDAQEGAGINGIFH
jgi:hypothetical protein